MQIPNLTSVFSLGQGCPTFLTGGPRVQISNEGVERGREWGGGVLLPSRLGGLRKHHKLPQQGLGWSPGRKQVLVYFRAWKNTPDWVKSIIFDISVRLRGPDRNAWRAGLWPAGRMLDMPGLDSMPQWVTTLTFQSQLMSKVEISTVNKIGNECDRCTGCQCECER